MSNFLSAVVLRNGDVLTHPLLDSHADLVTWFKLPDTSALLALVCLGLLVVDVWSNRRRV